MKLNRVRKAIEKRLEGKSAKYIIDGDTTHTTIMRVTAPKFGRYATFSNYNVAVHTGEGLEISNFEYVKSITPSILASIIVDMLMVDYTSIEVV